MHIKEVSKDTVFIKKVGDAFLVDQQEEDGIKTVRVTKNPMKAKHFTAEEAYHDTWNNLSEYDMKRLIKGHKENDNYSSLSRHVNDHYQVLKPIDINYGYSGDIEAEAKLLRSMNMDYMIEDVPVVTKSIDEEEIE